MRSIQVYGFDTETTPLGKESPKFKICSVFGESKKQVFDSPPQIAEFFSSLRESTVMVSYNLPFDYFILSKQYDFKLFRITKINLNTRPYFVIMKKDTTINGEKVKFTLTFIGLENFVTTDYSKGVSLRNLAKIFRTKPKLECSLTLSAKSKKLREYCLRDAEIVYEIYTKYFFNVSKRNRVRLSIPSIAFSELIESLPVKLDNRRSKTVKRFEQQSYFGGRTEIFDYQKRNASMYDINSLYPYVMSILKTPIKFKSIIPNPSISKIKEIIDSKDETFIFHGTTWCHKPILPVKIKDKIIFPVGEVKGFWCEPEIAYALQNKMIRILQSNFIIIYHAQIGIFSNFVKHYYKQRLSHKKGTALNLLPKLKMNSAYGKFAQKKKFSSELTEKEYRHSRLVDGGDYWEKRGIENIKYTYREINGKWIKERKTDEECYGKFTAIAAFTTSQARVELAKLIFPHKREVYYVDTDCVVTTYPYETGNNLGELKLEMKGKFRPFALKFYSLGNYHRQKGIPFNNPLSRTKVISESEEEIKFSFRKPLKMLEAKKRSLPAYSLVHVEKTIRRNYDKGYVANNHVYPLIMLGGKILNHSCDNLKKLRCVYGDSMWQKE